MLNKYNKMRKFNEFIFVVLTFVFVSVFFFASLVSAGNYRFQNTSGYDLQRILLMKSDFVQNSLSGKFCEEETNLSEFSMRFMKDISGIVRIDTIEV